VIQSHRIESLCSSIYEISDTSDANDSFSHRIIYLQRTGHK